MRTRLLLSGVCVALLFGAGLEARQAAQPTPPAPAPTQPVPPPETAQPEREGRQGRTTRRTRRTPASAPRREVADNLAPRDGGPVRQTLTLSANLMAGYDDNLTAGLGTGTGIAPTAMTSGYTGSLDGTLDYRRGNARNDLRIGTIGNLMAYPGYIDTPAAGIAGTMDGKTTMGRRVTLNGGGRVGYEPFFNAFSPGTGTPLPPGSTPSTPVAGLFERRSLNSNARVSTEARVSRRDSLSASYAFTSQSFLDEQTPDADAPQPFLGGDSSGHTVGVGYKRVVSSGVRARSDYQFSDISYDDSLNNTLPTRTHRIEGGADVEHLTARGQQLVTWTVMAGAARVEAVGSAQQLPYTAWLPVGSASLRVPFTQTAGVEATYRREFQLLWGVTNDVYATDTAAVSTNFGVAPRTDLRLIGSFGNWKTPVASGVSDTFNVYGAGAQLRVLLTDSVGLTGGYYYYHHRYSNPAGLPEGFPSSYDRNAFRVGLTFFMPVVSPPMSRAARPGPGTR